MSPNTHKPPKTKGASWFSGDMKQFGENSLQFATKMPQEYGDIFIIHGGVTPFKFLMLTNPDYAQHVLQTNNKNYIKEQRLVKIIEGRGYSSLFSSDGKEWLKRRRVMQPAFHRKKIDHFGKIMTDEAEKMVEKWAKAAAENEAIDVAEEMKDLTMQVIGRSMFSLEMGEDAGIFHNAYSTFTYALNDRLNTLINLPLAIPTKRNQLFSNTMDTLLKEIGKFIEARLAEPADTNRPTDLLDMLLEVYLSDDNIWTPEELATEMSSIIFAGHETTATTLTFAFALLAQHPDIAHRIDNELATVLNGRTPTVEDLPDLPLTKMVVQESLRLYPAAWGTTRESLAEDRLGDYEVPAKSKLIINIWGLHHDPRYWEKPNEFYPEHFTPEQEKARHPYAFIPFGGGPRKCIGYMFAMTEAQLVLATIWQKAKLTLKAGFTPAPDTEFTLQAKGGMPMLVEMR
jgi:cytochrome P450